MAVFVSPPDRLLSPAKVRCPLNRINAAKRGERKRLGVPEILLKILLKQNPQAYLKYT